MGLKAGGPLFAVRDMERSLAFYRDVLGLEVVNDFGANVVLTGGLSLQTLETWVEFLDELPDEFIAFLRRELKSRCRDGLLIGEVWEDASTKCGANGRRRYTDGHELDGVMNYPFMEAVYGFLLNRIDAPELALRLTALRQNYPKAFYESSLSMLSSHDTLRLLTALSGAPDRNAISREEQAVYRPDADMLRIGKKRVTQAQLIQLLHPGIPCVSKARRGSGS